MRCEKKRHYPTQALAQLAADAENEGRGKKDLPIRVYQCWICKTWHLTHKRIRRSAA